MIHLAHLAQRRSTLVAGLLALGIALAAPPARAAAAEAQPAGAVPYELAYALSGPGLYTTFGADLAVRSRRLFVGAPAFEGGDSYLAVFDLASGTPLLRQPGESDSVFGAALTASARSIAVGAPGGDDVRGYVLLLDPRGRSLRSIIAPTGYDQFGRELSWLGGRLFVHARRAGPSASPAEDGVVLLMNARTGALRRAISSPRPEIAAWFGRSMAPVHGGIAIASPGAGTTGDTAPGQVHLYDRHGELVRTLSRPSSAAGDHFGIALAGARNRMLVGAPSHWLAGDGAAYLYAWREGTWVLERTFVSPEGSHFFGSAVALDHEHALITGDEKVHLFDLRTGDLLATVAPPPPADPEEPPPYPRGAFGSAVALAGRTLVVAAPRQDENEPGWVFTFVPAR